MAHFGRLWIPYARERRSCLGADEVVRFLAAVGGSQPEGSCRADHSRSGEPQGRQHRQQPHGHNAALAALPTGLRALEPRMRQELHAPGRDNMPAAPLPADSSLLRLHRRVPRQFPFVSLLVNPSRCGATVLRLNGVQRELQLLGPRDRLAQRLTRRELASVQLRRSLPQLRPAARSMQRPALQRGTRVRICQRPVGLALGGRIMVVERRRRIR